MTPFYKDSFSWKVEAIPIAFLAIYSVTSKACFGEKSLAYKFIPTKLCFTISGIFSKISLILDYQKLKTCDIPNRRFKCYSCRNVENFYLKKVVSDSEYKDNNCTVCFEVFKANQEILFHSGDGNKHPIHVICCNAPQNITQEMLRRKNDCEAKIKYDLVLMTTILFGAICAYRITPPIDPNRVTTMLPNYIPQ